jgi:hypothetical protein
VFENVQQEKQSDKRISIAKMAHFNILSTCHHAHTALESSATAADAATALHFFQSSKST